jgi:hypothetical protein
MLSGPTQFLHLRPPDYLDSIAHLTDSTCLERPTSEHASAGIQEET